MRSGGCTWSHCAWPPLFSATAGLLFERYVGLDRHTALAAGIAIGCGMLAFAATAVVSLRVMFAREVCKRERPAVSPQADRDPSPVA